MEDIMEKIFCNACGKELKVDNGIPKEDFIRICKSWGYFSKKDGITQEFTICEECVEKLEGEFILPFKQYETIEML
ncbi:MAG: hypothetical protein HFJ06_05280 [Lachnospiraceae bacterium]|nr:hypothetical protein [Lachnospiraceae bacterium]